MTYNVFGGMLNLTQSINSVICRPL